MISSNEVTQDVGLIYFLLKEVIQLENATDKVEIKMSTARNLSNKYGEIIRRLKSVSIPFKPYIR